MNKLGESIGGVHQNDSERVEDIRRSSNPALLPGGATSVEAELSQELMETQVILTNHLFFVFV